LPGKGCREGIVGGPQVRIGYDVRDHRTRDVVVADDILKGIGRRSRGRHEDYADSGVDHGRPEGVDGCARRGGGEDRFGNRIDDTRGIRLPAEGQGLSVEEIR